MRENFRNKFAVFMACASVLAGKSSAMNMNKNDIKNPQNLGAVGGEILTIIPIYWLIPKFLKNLKV